MARAARFVADRLDAAGRQALAVHPTAGHPVVFAEWHGDETAATVLVYGHYDVQPPEPLEPRSSGSLSHQPPNPPQGFSSS